MCCMMLGVGVRLRSDGIMRALDEVWSVCDIPYTCPAGEAMTLTKRGCGGIPHVMSGDR